MTMTNDVLEQLNYLKWIVNTFLDNFYENILNSTGVL